VRGVDPEALAALTRLLDLLADAFEQIRSELRAVVHGLTVVPAIDRLGEVAVWVRSAADTARRVALQALSAGQPWRHRDLLDHLGGVMSAFGSGLVNGTEGMVRGLWAAIETNGQNTVSAAVSVWDASRGDWAGVEAQAGQVLDREKRMVEAVGHSVVALAESQPPMFAWHIHEDGFWRAADDLASATGQQIPSLLLTVATSGAGAEAGVVGDVGAAADIADQLGMAGYLDPRSVTRGAVPMSADDVVTMDFSVAVAGEPGHRVGLDPQTGDFLVARSDGDGGIGVTEKRWSHLSDAERRAMKNSSVVDGHGRLASV